MISQLKMQLKDDIFIQELLFTENYLSGYIQTNEVSQALQPPRFCLTHTHTHLVNVGIQGVVVIQLISFVLQLLIQDTVHGIKHLPLKFHFWNENLSWKHMQ